MNSLNTATKQIITSCIFCGKPFSSSRNLERHLNVHKLHKSKKKFKCEPCEKSFLFASSLNKHIKSIHEGLKDYKCQSCEKKFTWPWALKAHKKTHREDHFQCDFCDKLFSEYESLEDHTKLMHDVHVVWSSNSKISNCPKSPNLGQQSLEKLNFKLTTKLRKTDLLISSNPPKSQNLEQVITEVDQTLILKETNSDQTVEKPNFKPTRTSNFQTEFNAVPKKDYDKCESFEKSECLRANKSKYNQDSYICKFCSTKLSNVKAMKEHIRKTHFGNFKCDLCDKLFSVSGNLEDHRKFVHPQEIELEKEYNNYELEDGKSFYDTLETIIKMNDEKDLKSYSCNTCGDTFSDTQWFECLNHILANLCYLNL